MPTGAATVAQTPPGSEESTGEAVQLRRARAVVVTRSVAYVFVVAMLGFGLIPIVNGVVEHRPVWKTVAGSVGILLIALAFIRLVSTAMRRPWCNDAWRQAAVVTASALVLPVAVHTDWQVVGFLAVAAVAVTLPPRYGLVAALGVLVLLTAERILLGLSGVAFLTVQDVLTAAAMTGIIVLVAFVEELFAARAEIARLAVAAERNRFARDLHDTLGHNLSAITLKSELAGHLLEIDVERARQELADVNAIARESLNDVRTVVTGYRRDSLARELQGVQSVLVSAGVRCEVTQLAEALPAPVEEALAWAVREAATNLLRHSVASRCDVHVTLAAGGVRLEVTNDGVGVGKTDPVGGNGLTGLAERLAPLGGQLDAGVQLNGEFALRVTIPMQL